MILSYKYKLKPSNFQRQIMTDWLSMLRSHYNYCLRDRIDAYEEARSPRLGNYCDLKTLAEICPLTCHISKNSSLGEPFRNNGKKRSAYEQQSSELPHLKKNRPWYKKIYSSVLQQNLKRLDVAFKNFFEGKGYPKFKARLDQKVVNQREDYQWKIAHKLVRLGDVIVLEDLNIKGMTKRCKAKQDELGRFLKNGQSAKSALNRLIRDCSWGNLKQKIQSVAEKFGCITLDVNPQFTSQTCSHCGHVERENRDKERFLCLNCGFLADADIQASVNIGKKGIQILGLSLNKLLGVTQEVTAKPESTGLTRDSQDKSVSLETEPSNPNPPLTPS